MYNLTNSQKDLLRWFVQQSRANKLEDEYTIAWTADRPVIAGLRLEANEFVPPISKGALDALAQAELLTCSVTYRSFSAGYGGVQQNETSRRCTLLGKAFEAVDNNFDAPDTSFVKHLTPLADITNFDAQLKQRCLPILGAGSADPALWDSAVRTAGVILEERLRDVGGVTDPALTGQSIVNAAFGDKGTLANKFSVESERKGYRDLYAGIFGVFRNPSAHRHLDPTPEEGGAFLAFANLLLKKLEDLR